MDEHLLKVMDDYLIKVMDEHWIENVKLNMILVRRNRKDGSDVYLCSEGSTINVHV